MTEKQFQSHRWVFIAISTLYIWALLAYEHLNSGVVSHHLLQREDLPAISNWWGALVLPLLALLFPLYRAECLLGFVLGMCFTFGVLIPTGLGTLVVLMSFILHKTLRPLLACAFGFLIRSRRSN